MSGLSQDMRELEASDSPAARDAIAYFVSRMRREFGGLAAAVKGVDAIVFTAGIGENAWQVRERAQAWSGWASISTEANRTNALIITPRTSPTCLRHPDRRGTDDRRAHGYGRRASEKA